MRVSRPVPHHNGAHREGFTTVLAIANQCRRRAQEAAGLSSSRTLLGLVDDRRELGLPQAYRWNTSANTPALPAARRTPFPCHLTCKIHAAPPTSCPVTRDAHLVFPTPASFYPSKTIFDGAARLDAVKRVTPCLATQDTPQESRTTADVRATPWVLRPRQVQWILCTRLAPPSRSAAALDAPRQRRGRVLFDASR
ncbi:hypothetical protein K438DRAFT_1952802 [Mycena galopus ATCC 62051]|nr:hypothetical protein K438DRAFT_1952802 [Mycena galopus ATCC 62051]